MEILFFIKRVVSLALVPPIGFFVMALVLWLAYLVRQQWRLWRGINLRTSREWGSSGSRANSLGSLLSVIVFLLFAGLASMTGVVSSWLVNLVESHAGQPLDDRAAKALMARPSTPQAVVVLGGGSDFDAREPNGPFTLNARTMRRVIHGTRIAKLTGLKVLVSGGLVPPHTKAEAQSMAEFMERELSFRATWQELRSRDTRDNAMESARILNAQGITRIVLVTQAAHMRRSVLEFERAGFEVTPAPVGFQAAEGGLRHYSWLPAVGGATKTWYACHELLGWLWYRLSGRA